MTYDYGFKFKFKVIFFKSFYVTGVKYNIFTNGTAKYDGDVLLKVQYIPMRLIRYNIKYVFESIQHTVLEFDETTKKNLIIF